MADIFSKKKRREIMSKVKNKDTDIEIILRRKLWKEGYRYRLRHKILGSPDVVFPRERVAIFCDGDFWHGKDYEKEKGGYKKFWRDKIKKNIIRDQQVNRELRKKNWVVVRLWESEILRNIDGCFDKIRRCLEEIKNE